MVREVKQTYPEQGVTEHPCTVRQPRAKAASKRAHRKRFKAAAEEILRDHDDIWKSLANK